MNIETILGVIMLAAWAALVLWGLGQSVLSARRRQAWDYVVGLIIGCILVAGLMLMFHPHDASFFGVGFVLALGGIFEIWVFRHGLRPDAGARFKSDQKLQTAALEILEELIGKELLTVSVLITDPAASLSCRVREAIVDGSREATQEQIMKEMLTGEAIKTKPRQGIELLLNQKFKLP
jgi:hypothetical protein